MDMLRSYSYKQNIKSRARQAETIVIGRDNFLQVLNSVMRVSINSPTSLSERSEIGDNARSASASMMQRPNSLDPETLVAH